MKIEICRVNGDKTHKALGVEEVVDDAVTNGVQTVSVISSGNYVRTIVEELRARNLSEQISVVNLTNRHLDVEGCAEIPIGGQRILRDSQEREKYVAAHLQRKGLFRDYTDFQPRAYKRTAERILGVGQAEPPDYISLGVGSGKLFLALEEVIRTHGLKTRLVGILPRGENGIFNDDNLEERDGMLFYKRFEPRSVADKLVCPFTSFKPQLLEAQQRGHIFAEVGNRELSWAYGLLVVREAFKDFGTRGEPSASAGCVIEYDGFAEKYELDANGRAVAVFTGVGDEFMRSPKRRAAQFMMALVDPRTGRLPTENYCV